MDISVEKNQNGSLTLRTLVRDPKNPELGPYFHKKTYYGLYRPSEVKADFRQEIKDTGLKPVD